MASPISLTLASVRTFVVQRALATAAATVDSEMLRFRSPVLSHANATLARYGGRHNVTVLPGDGIGPEMLAHVEKIFDFAQVPVDFESVNLSSSSENSEDDLQQAITAIVRNGVALKGNIETKFNDPQFKSRNMELRRQLNLVGNVLHCASIPTIPSRHKGIDMIIIRENTEGEYSGLEHEATNGVVESLKIVTREKMEWISRFAFQYAVKYGRKKVTAVHKANIQKLGDEIAENEYPQIKFEAMIVDNASMQLVAKPQQFDIMVMPNLYGNIISNIACGLVGGPGLVSGMNIGTDYAVFETGTRNTGTSLAGQDVANPTAFIRASVDMLRYLGLGTHADMISDALYRTLVEKKVHTRDIGGTAKASELVDAVLEYLEKDMTEKKWRLR